jgi:hypothetical protein
MTSLPGAVGALSGACDAGLCRYLTLVIANA